jgi:hypothetical protein
MTFPPLKENRRILLTWALAIFCPCSFLAQTPAKRPPPKSAQARQEELAKVQELLSDPDPNARLANMEEIVKSGDATRLQVALRIVFHSDDPNMRALGLRAYIASLHELTFDIELPAQAQRQYDDAQADDDKMNALLKQHPYLAVFAGFGFRISLDFSKYDMTKTTGVITDSRSQTNPGAFAVSGDRVAGTFRLSSIVLGSPPCSFDFKPTADMVLKGSLSCDASGHSIMIPRLSISAPIF